MKYLLGYLEGIEDAPALTDPGFQQLLVDVQAGKTAAKSADAWYESLEKIVNELKSSPESVVFHRPVSKRDAPDYHNYISKPMDLSTVLRNIRAHKYKNKVDFAADLDLIWENCLTYNTQETHPIRASARYMQQKANHHLEFLADRNERGANPLLPLLAAGVAPSPAPSRALSAQAARAASTRAESTQPQDDEDAAGESDDGEAQGAGGVKTLPGANGLPTPANGHAMSATSAPSIRVSGKVNGDVRPLPVSLDVASALVRTPHTMSSYLPVSLLSGPSFSDKGKARDLLYGAAPPAWYPPTDDEDGKLEGAWYAAMQRDDAYVAGLPAVPSMPAGPATRRRRLVRRRASGSGTHRPSAPDAPDAAGPAPLSPPPLSPSGPVSLERVVHRAAAKLADARRLTAQIADWQRIDADGGTLPAPSAAEPLRRPPDELAAERTAAKRRRRGERAEARKRRRAGGETGELEAALAVKHATAGMLAHAGFEGANETALDMFTRVAVNHLRDLGRTMRLLVDSFSHDMDAEDIILHTLHEAGHVQPAELEAHIKDDIERDSAKVAEMERKVRAAYKDIDDMIFNADGQMLQHGDFAEDLGEDFLGLRELGLEKEFGLASLSVPKSLFFGRRGRGPGADAEQKEDAPEYPPPPPFVPLGAQAVPHLPALLHAFFAQRVEAGLGLQDDAAFDPAQAQIGPLGQIVVKKEARKVAKKDDGAAAAATGAGAAAGAGAGAGAGAAGAVAAGAAERKKAPPPKKPVVPGVGKGNWIRPPKEERDRRAAEKKALLARRQAEEREEDDAEGEDE